MSIDHAAAEKHLAVAPRDAWTRAGAGLLLAAILLCWPMLADAAVPSVTFAAKLHAEMTAGQGPRQPVVAWTFPPVPKASPLAAPAARPRTDPQELLIGGLLALPAFGLLGFARRLVFSRPRIVSPRRTCLTL